MDFIEHIRVGKERSQAGLGAKQDRPSSIRYTWIVLRIGVAEDPPAEGDELFTFLVWRDYFRHVVGCCANIRPHDLCCRLNLSYENLKGTDGQSTRRFGGV